MTIAHIILMLAGTYLGIGAIIATVFLMRIIQRVDSAAESSGLIFRMMMFPGCVLLWPIVWRLWARGPAHGEHKS